MKATTSLNMLHILYWNCFLFLKTSILLLLKAAARDLCQRWVMDDLMVLCPVYCVYNVLADISIPLGERRTPYLQSNGARKGERVRKREACWGRRGEEHQKEEMLNILIPFLALHVHLYLAVWASREEAEPSTCNWFTLLRGPRHRDVPIVRCLWHRNWFIIQCRIQLIDSITVTQAGHVVCL